MKKSVFITGITGGLGMAMTEVFINNGYEVSGTCTVNSSRKESFLASYPYVKLYEVDNREILSLESLFNNIFEGGSPNILINNSGIVNDSFIATMPNEHFSKVIDVNLISAWLISKSFINNIDTEESNYKIISISSISGIIGKETQTNYALTKGGLIGLTQLLERTTNIGSICIAPGLIDTDIKKKMSLKSLKEFENTILAHRLGTPIEIANFIFALSGDDISYCNGATYTVDGGVLK